MSGRWPTSAIEVVDGLPRRVFPGRLVTGAESVVTRIACVLWTIQGSWPDDQTKGLRVLDWTLPSMALVVIEGIVREQVIRVEGVVRVVEVIARRPGTRLTIGVVAEVSDGTGETTTQALVGDLSDIWQGYVPGAWYTLVQVGVRPIMTCGL